MFVITDADSTSPPKSPETPPASNYSKFFADQLTCVSVVLDLQYSTSNYLIPHSCHNLVGLVSVHQSNFTELFPCCIRFSQEKCSSFNLTFRWIWNCYLLHGSDHFSSSSILDRLLNKSEASYLFSSFISVE